MSLTVDAWQLRTQHTFSRAPGLREQRALNKRRGWPGLDWVHALHALHRAVITAPRLCQDGVKRESPPVCSQMTRVVPRQGMLFSRLAGKNFLCTPRHHPCNLACDEKGLAQIAAFGPLQDLPHTFFALVAGEKGTCSLRTSTPDCSPNIHFKTPPLMYRYGRQCLSPCGSFVVMGLRRSSTPTHTQQPRAGSARIHNPGCPSSPQPHSHFGNRIASS